MHTNFSFIHLVNSENIYINISMRSCSLFIRSLSQSVIHSFIVVAFLVLSFRFKNDCWMVMKRDEHCNYMVYIKIGNDFTWLGMVYECMTQAWAYVDTHEFRLPWFTTQKKMYTILWFSKKDNKISIWCQVKHTITSHKQNVEKNISITIMITERTCLSNVSLQSRWPS